MILKKYILIIFLSFVILSTSLISSQPVVVSAAKIETRRAITVWRYLYKRQYNKSEGMWIGNWVAA